MFNRILKELFNATSYDGVGEFFFSIFEELCFGRTDTHYKSS